MAFTPYYPGGWQSGEEGGTPITPDALNHYDDAFDDVYDAIQQSTANYSSESVAQYITRSDGSTENNGRIVYFGNVVTIHLTLAGVSLAAGENTVATLSKAYPTWAVTAGYPTACGFIGAGSAIGSPVRCTLDANGVLKVYASAAITSTLRVTFCYGTGNGAL